MDRGTWQATVHGIIKSRTQLIDRACPEHKRDQFQKDWLLTLTCQRKDDHFFNTVPVFSGYYCIWFLDCHEVGRNSAHFTHGETQDVADSYLAPFRSPRLCPRSSYSCTIDRGTSVATPSTHNVFTAWDTYLDLLSEWSWTRGVGKETSFWG